MVEFVPELLRVPVLLEEEVARARGIPHEEDCALAEVATTSGH